MPPVIRCRWWESHTEGAAELLIIQLLANLTAWVKRATTHTNSAKRLHMCSPVRQEQGSYGREQEI
jgi:hypothetical protein